MKRYLLTLLTIPFFLAGCAQNPVASGSNPPLSQAVDALNAFHWQLSDATDRQGNRLDACFVQNEKPVRIDFKTDRFSISNACNLMNGTYLLNGNTVTFSNMISTKMLCTPQLNALEQKVTAQLQQPASIELYLSASPVMKLGFEDGTNLTFSGTPTAATRYGNAGETIFMEIAANTIECDQNAVTGKTCFQVRDVYYDNNGVMTGTSAWRVFATNIEGYRHQEGTGHILRIKRYKVPNAPVPASDAYILDMIVQ